MPAFSLFPTMFAKGFFSLTLTHYQTTKFRLFADDNFKFEKNGRRLSKRIENTVGKGEIAHYQQFLLFPQACFPAASKGVIVWEWVKTDFCGKDVVGVIPYCRKKIQ